MKKTRFDPDAITWKRDIPQDREGGVRVRYFEEETRFVPGAGEVTFKLAGGTGRWFVWRSHFGASDQPHRTTYFPNRRLARECFEYLAYE